MQAKCTICNQLTFFGNDTGGICAKCAKIRQDTIPVADLQAVISDLAEKVEREISFYQNFNHELNLGRAQAFRESKERLTALLPLEEQS